MKEHPILFSSPMVRAILEGRKTQTRRVVKLPSWSTGDWDDFELEDFDDNPVVICENTGCLSDIVCPYGKPGDRLWVRETWVDWFDGFLYRATPPQSSLLDYDKVKKWQPSIFMPRKASRITLEVTNIRVERLNDISEADAKAEGVQIPVTANGNWARCISSKYVPQEPTYREHFRMLWEEINGKKMPWSSNPWLWVVEFKKLDI